MINKDTAKNLLIKVWKTSYNDSKLSKDKSLKDFYAILKAYTEGYKFEDNVEIESVLAYEFLSIENILYKKYYPLYEVMRIWKSSTEDYFKNKLIVDVDNGFFDLNSPILIAGFPGVGKSSAAKIFDEKIGKNICIDLESSDFHWIVDKSGNRHQHPEWPMNYVNAAKALLFETRGLEDYKNLKFICISTHKESLSILNEQEVEFCIVTPINKEKSIKRYKERGSSLEFIKSIDENWDKYMDDIYSYDMPVIMTDEYLCNILKDNRLVRFIGNKTLADNRRKILIELGVAN